MYYSISNFYCAYGAICYTNWSLLIHGTCITSMLVLSCVWSPHYFLWHLFMTKKKTHVYHLLNVYHMMSDSANMLDSWWLWILFLLSCIIYNHLYPWAIHLLLWDLTVCALFYFQLVWRKGCICILLPYIFQNTCSGCQSFP